MNDGVKVNIFYNSIYQLTSILIPLITTPYLSRVLGAEGIGEYGYAYSVAYYFTLFIKLGLNNYGSREIAYNRRDKKSSSKIFWELYLFQLFLGVICLFVYMLYATLLSTNKIISIIFSLYVISSVIDVTWFFWGLEEFKQTVRRDFIVKILSTVGIFLFVKTSADTWKYTFLISLSFLLSQVFLWPSLIGRIQWMRPKLGDITKHIKPNFVLFIPLIAISLYKTMDKIMLGFLSTETEVGYYHNSENVIQVPIVLVTALGTVMQPRMAKMVSDNESDKLLKDFFGKSIIYALFLSTSVGFGIMTVAREFVPLFYGAGFERCIDLFYILLPCGCFMAFANVIRTQFLIPRKKDKEYIISLFAGASVNLVFNYIFIPRLQSVGAALGTLLAEATVCFVQAWLIRKEMKTFRYFVEILPCVIAGVLMFVLWNGVSFNFSNVLLNLGLKIVLAGVTYLVIVAILFGILSRFMKLDLTLADIKGLFVIKKG